MSANNKKPKMNREEKNKLFIRILAGLMALLMVAGMAYYTIYILTSTVGADQPENSLVAIDTSSLKESGMLW